MYIIGWIGTILLALCGLPQVIRTYKTGQTHDLSWSFLFMWWVGELLTFIYVIYNDHTQLPLLMNYGLNIILVFYLLFMKSNNGD